VLSGGMLAAPMLASGVARAADDWPNKPVRYINVFPPGGPTDTLSRIVCNQLAELTGQQFIVDNKSGSGGNVGTDAIAKAAPDGYTIGLYTIASQSIAPTLYAKLPFDVDKDFTAVAMMWSVPNMLMVRLDLPVKSVPELTALCKATPGKYSFASSGSGTSPHLSGEIYKQRAGLSGPSGRPGRHDVRQHTRPARTDALGQGARACCHVQGAPPRRARSSDHGGVPAGLRDHLVGRHLRTGRPAAGRGREAVGPHQEGARHRRRESELRAAGRDADLDDSRRHRGLPRHGREAAGACHQGVGRKGGLTAAPYPLALPFAKGAA
jgi:Tripartite tricarboxylate transporter family receptor